MKFILIAAGCWLLLNLLYVLIVIPPRNSRSHTHFARVKEAIQRFVRSRKRPPS